MKIALCVHRCASVSALALGILAFGAIAQADPADNHKIEWVAQSAAGNVVSGLGTNDLVLSAGGVEVYFDIIVSGWGAVAGAPQLAVFNAGLIGSGLLGVNATPWNPGVDLETESKVECTSDGDCAWGFCGIFEDFKCDVNQAGYIRAKVCTSTQSQHCKTGAHCPAGEFCIDNALFCLAGTSAEPYVDLESPARDWEWIGAAGSGAVTDPGWPMYMGTLKFVVPGAAAGTYTLGFNPADDVSFFNDGNSLKITGLTLVPGTVSVQIGRCCYGLSTPGEGCVVDVKDSTCTQQYSAPRIWEADALCPQRGGPVCPECVSNADCKDPTNYQVGNDNKCTEDTCTEIETCTHTNLWDDSVNCCDPDAGVATGLTPIDDFDLCTADSCVDGFADHDRDGADGTACDDGSGCRFNDLCTGGVCAGTDMNAVSCTSDDQCVDDTGSALDLRCNVDTELCECSELTPICIDLYGKVCEGTSNACKTDDDCEVGVACIGDGVNAPWPDGNCFETGDSVMIAVEMGVGSTMVTGAAVALEYDTSCLKYNHYVIVEPFTNVLTGPRIDEVAGTIYFSATVPYDQGANTVGAGTKGPADILWLGFEKLAGCDECDICLFDENPGYTILTSDTGNRVDMGMCGGDGCMKPIRGAGAIDLVVPAGDDVNSDCGLPTATIEWPTPSATDSCDIPADLDVECEGASSFGTVTQADVDSYVLNGGEMLQGKYFFICDASNSCGKVARKVWTVNISDQHSIDVEVHLSPQMNPGLFTRAITFVAYADCDKEITTFCEVMDFGPPANFRAHARTSLKVDKGNYLCITAQDELHTLRAAADIECIDNKWVATFKGDPRIGGNWLVGGNLDAAKDGINYSDANSINIVDFGVFMSEVAGGAAYNAPGNTDCDTDWPHGDINADGAVDSVDYSFILGNYLMTSKGACCPAPLGQVIVPTQEISVKELRRTGLGKLAVGDLNGDGVLNADDMAAYMQGVLPSYSDLNRGKQGSRR